MPGELPIPPLNREQIMKVIPHRDGFLWVATIDVIEPGKLVRGRFVDFMEDRYKTMREAHFSVNPDEQYVPGVLISEGCNQNALVGIVYSMSTEVIGEKLALLARSNMEFKKPVRPTDSLILEAEITSMRSRLAQGYVRALLPGNVVAVQGEVTCFLVDRPKPELHS